MCYLKKEMVDIPARLLQNPLTGFTFTLNYLNNAIIYFYKIVCNSQVECKIDIFLYCYCQHSEVRCLRLTRYQRLDILAKLFGFHLHFLLSLSFTSYIQKYSFSRVKCFGILLIYSFSCNFTTILTYFDMVQEAYFASISFEFELNKN